MVPERDVVDELERILSSESFQRSPRLSRFLRYTVERTLRGEAGDIKEYLIGVEVFDKGPDFDPRTDTVVRSQATRLRAMLSSYYREQGSQDPVVIEFPRGAYVPSFAPRSTAPEMSAGDAETPMAVKPPEGVPAGLRFRLGAKRWALIGSAAVLAAGAVLLYSVLGRTSVWEPRLAAHLTLPLPPGTGLDFDRGPAIASPSGKYLILPLIETSNVRRLWLRPLNSSAAWPLHGTEEGALPFWSPDENRFGFFAGGKLRIYRLEDGVIQDIADAPFGRGGTWNRDDTILFGRHSSGPIYRISASGGQAVPVTRLNPALEENDHRWPEFLPDGQSFLFSTRSRNGEKSGVFLGRLGSEEPIRLLSSGSQAHYVRTSGGTEYLLSIRGGALTCRLFDSRSGKVEGKEQVLADGVRYSLSSGAAFSVAGDRLLVFHTHEAETTEPVWLERQGRTLREWDNIRATSGLTLSPDGRRIALEISTHPKSPGDIWIADIDRGAPMRFTYRGGGYPVWAPDSRGLIYSNAADGIPSLFLKRFTNTDAEMEVRKSRHPMYPTDWSPDGRFLAFHEDHPDSLMDLYLLPLNPRTYSPAAEPVLVRKTPFHDTHGFFSPDGRLLAYVSDESGRPEVYVQELSFPNPRDGRRWQVSEHGGAHPRWRRDGRELYFLSPGKVLFAAPVEVLSSGWKFGTPVRLFSTRSYSGGDSKSPFSVLPDGRSFLMNTLELNSAVSPVHAVLHWSVSGGGK